MLDTVIINIIWFWAYPFTNHFSEYSFI